MKKFVFFLGKLFLIQMFLSLGIMAYGGTIIFNINDHNGSSLNETVKVYYEDYRTLLSPAHPINIRIGYRGGRSCP